MEMQRFAEPIDTFALEDWQGASQEEKHMKVFTNEFEKVLAKVIGCSLVIGLVVLVFGIVGGIEQGLIW